ncbi:DNA photolyase phr1 [Sporothrix epigloea]|uniref:DNA photolyase phr1 n=1 Tax=Sporothrix epigloea TaxID=1892477 RepID=A0ABP0DFF9_9PEZI
MPAAPKRKISNGGAPVTRAGAERANGANGANGASGSNGENKDGSNAMKKVKSAESSSPRASSKTDALRRPHPHHRAAEESGIVLRQFYPPEMSTARVMAYIDGRLPTPMSVLNTAVKETAKQLAKAEPPSKESPVVHFFKSDLRVHDNRALSQARALAKENEAPLVGLYVVSPQDWEAHNTAPVRVDFMLRTLTVLQEDLAKLNIPLWIETVEDRKQVPRRILELMDTWKARHLFANLEYEPDELRRETKLVRLCASQGKTMTVVHDTCGVPPGELVTGGGKQYSVYTPWFRAFKQRIHDDEHVIDQADDLVKVPDSIKEQLPKELFGCAIPEAPEGKRLTDEEKKRFHQMWPAGEHEASARLEKFCKTRIDEYADKRDFPAASATSALSPYLASGAICTRTIIHTASDRAKASSLDSGSKGFRVWISEVAWRDFYKHVLVNWPFIAMNKPYKYETANIEWSTDDSDAKFEAWTQGRTGYPIVDAAMRQLLHEGWMHNRTRMIVASFLSKDLLVDWRRGEQWFMRHLVDGDVASNIGGWGFAASVGVDPQPYFRIFNPYLQSEKFDADGKFIRQWLPELARISGKAIHEPYARGAGSQAQKAGYPKPLVDHKAARDIALAAYKKASGKE